MYIVRGTTSSCCGRIIPSRVNWYLLPNRRVSQAKSVTALKNRNPSEVCSLWVGEFAYVNDMGTDVSDVKFVRTAFVMYVCDEQFW